jgi:tetratricopeptide (TPR) repeat protein
MNIFLVALLLMQSALVLPARTAVENPAAVSQIPPKLQKDYDKLWSRFVFGQEDAKLTKDLDLLLKKQKDFDPVLTIEGYIELYKGNDAGADQKFQQAYAANPNNRIAAYYLAELAYAHKDYVRANTFYSVLLSLDKTRSDLEPKRLKAALLAVDDLLRFAARAEMEKRLSDAEEFYRRALAMAPKEPLLHLRFADLLAKENKTEEAAAENKVAEDLMPRRADNVPTNTEPRGDDLEDLGRWGSDIAVFRQIRNAPVVTREQVVAVIVKYFPQVLEHRQTPQIVTDIDSSSARTEIQTVVDVGLMDLFANHTFEPEAAMTRGDFATALARLIRMLGLSPPSAAPTDTPDVAPTNTQYADIQLVLGYALMNVQDSGNFDVSGDVSGRQAVDAADRLMRTFQQAQH